MPEVGRQGCRLLHSGQLQAPLRRRSEGRAQVRVAKHSAAGSADNKSCVDSDS